MIFASLPALVQSFFTDRLLQQRHASPHTIAAYRDSFRLLLNFAAQRLGKAPSDLLIGDLDAPFIGEFLQHLEIDRGNSARTRNTRLAAIHSFFRYVALTEPAYALVCQRVLAMPSKRFVKRPLEFLNRAEFEALLAAPDPSIWTGRRDRTLLLVAIQTGLRVSELIGLCWRDVALGSGAHVRCVGKGRKHRSTPLRRDAQTMLRAWLQHQHAQPEDRVFPSIRGGALSLDAFHWPVADPGSHPFNQALSARDSRLPEQHSADRQKLGNLPPQFDVLAQPAQQQLCFVLRKFAINIGGQLHSYRVIHISPK